MLYFRLILSPIQKTQLIKSLENARHKGDLTVVNRILAVLAYASPQNSVEDIANLLHISTEFIRTWVKKYMQSGIKRVTFRERPPGRPNKLTKTQRKELSKYLEQGPQKAGFPGACWRTPMIQELILNKFGTFYNVRYISQLLKNMGFSYQKARFAVGGKDPDNASKRQQWVNKCWPEALALANKRNAYLFFEDEASFPFRGNFDIYLGNTG
jgi:transposase